MKKMGEMMSLQTAGLIFLLVGAGFFLSWGYTGGNVNYTFDMILGAIFAIIGFSLVMARNPLTDAAATFAKTANQIMDGPSVMLDSRETDERVKHINAEARQATREIKERARSRIHKISQEIGDMTASTAD